MTLLQCQPLRALKRSRKARTRVCMQPWARTLPIVISMACACASAGYLYHRGGTRSSVDTCHAWSAGVVCTPATPGRARFDRELRRFSPHRARRGLHVHLDLFGKKQRREHAVRDSWQQ